ncbi:preprotein translocase subunit SecG [bacterium]|nr:preprotein translocase subunit SecG [bacterium]
MAIFHIFVSILLIVLILFQEQGSGLSSAIGGSEFYATKRGLEKKIFYLTVIFGVLFVGIGIIRIILKK